MSALTVVRRPAEQTSPHDLDAERAVLGSVLIDNRAYATARAVLDAGAFFRDGHQRAFLGMARQAARGEAQDLVTLKVELERVGDLDRAGGPAYLASLVDQVPRADNVAHYAGIVADLAKRRQMIAALNRAVDDAHSGRAVGEIVAAIAAMQQAPRQERYRAARDLIASVPPDEIIEGIAWAGCITLLVGESGAGKSFAVASMLAAVSDGKPSWHGRGVAPGSVLYALFEGDAVSNRLRAVTECKGATLDNVYVLRGREPLSRRGEGAADGELLLARAINELRDDLAGRDAPPLKLIVVDTVRASMAGNEDSSEDVSAYLRAIHRLMAAAPGAAVILTHHAGWQDGETQKKRERGSSAWRGNVDATLYLETGPYDEQRAEAEITLRTLKVRDGERPAPLQLVRRRVEITGVDRRGNPLTSCVIDRSSRTGADREREAAAELHQEQAALDLRTLRAIVERPELATAVDGLQALLSVRRASVTDSIRRLVARGMVLPGGRGKPYTATNAGRSLLTEVTP